MPQEPAQKIQKKRYPKAAPKAPPRAPTRKSRRRRCIPLSPRLPMPR